MSRAASSQDRIDAEAADWLAAIECGTADRLAFEQWRSADPAHALAFLRVSQVSSELGSVRDLGLGERLAPSDEPAPLHSTGRRRLLSFGAMGLLAAGLTGFAWNFAAAAHEATTKVGERRRIVLADGLALELNTDSHVRWGRCGDGYDVNLLRGEVILERQTGSPLCRLRCGESEIEPVRGGLVDARSGPEGLELLVLKGEASLTLPRSYRSVRLPPLGRARLVDGEAPAFSALSPREAGSASAWQQGQIQFNGESLDDAVAEYNRYLQRPMQIADPSIRRLRLGGRFSATDPSDFYRALKQIYGVSTRAEGDRMRLLRS